MKSTCNKLEIIEKEYLDKLNRTKHNVKLLGDSKSFNYGTKLRKNITKIKKEVKKIIKINHKPNQKIHRKIIPAKNKKMIVLKIKI